MKRSRLSYKRQTKISCVIATAEATDSVHELVERLNRSRSLAPVTLDCQSTTRAKRIMRNYPKHVKNRAALQEHALRTTVCRGGS